MGIQVDREEFTAEDHAQFAVRLRQNLEVLQEMLGRPGFGASEPSTGVEVEMHLVDAAFQPACVNQAVLAQVADARCTVEIDAFNFELNSEPRTLTGRVFGQLGDELTELLDKVRAGAAANGASVLLAGTLPTLTSEHLQHPVFSDSPRYRAMSNALRKQRGAPFTVNIEGRESLSTSCNDLALEGANASLQVHLRVSAADFADVYNAAQLAAAPLVAASSNSPYLDGKCLWEETRIALFQQATDTRRGEHARRSRLARVSFGPGFAHDALDLFRYNAAAYEPLMPVVSKRDTVDGVPALDELRLHLGTVWNWNRAVYDPSCGGHLRIEHRVVASGPTRLDMLANTAFTLGLSLGLAPLMPSWLKDFPFAWVEQNLYSAAKHGLDAQLAWPSHRGPSPRLCRAREIVLELLPIAEKGLVRHGVDRDEAADLLAIVKERAESGQTGAAVQRRWVTRFEHDLPRPRALARMVGEYLPRSAEDVPVHRWQL